MKRLLLNDLEIDFDKTEDFCNFVDSGVINPIIEAYAGILAHNLHVDIKQARTELYYIMDIYTSEEALKKFNDIYYDL